MPQMLILNPGGRKAKRVGSRSRKAGRRARRRKKGKPKSHALSIRKPGVSHMARRRRRRRASAAPRRHRRRRRATHANPTHRRRSRRHRRRSYRRNPGRKFGLGGGKGLFGINPQTALTIAAGAAVSTVVVGRFLKSVKLPGAEGSTTRLMVNGLVGAAAAFFLGKMLKKPALGAQLALGAVVVPLGGILAAQASKFGGGTAGFGQFDDFPATTDDISGALYAAPDAVAGIGMDEDDDLSAFN